MIEIKDNTLTNTLNEAYLDLIQVGPITSTCAKKFKEVLNGLIQATWAQQIRGGPLKESHMINALFRLLKFLNNHFDEIGSWLARYGRKIYYFPFSDIFQFLEEAIREANQLFLF